MSKYTVNCWVLISVPIEVEANSDKKAEELALNQFVDMDLNKCDCGDYGTEILDRQ